MKFTCDGMNRREPISSLYLMEAGSGPCRLQTFGFSVQRMFSPAAGPKHSLTLATNWYKELIYLQFKYTKTVADRNVTTWPLLTCLLPSLRWCGASGRRSQGSKPTTPSRHKSRQQPEDRICGVDVGRRLPSSVCPRWAAADGRHSTFTTSIPTALLPETTPRRPPPLSYTRV